MGGNRELRGGREPGSGGGCALAARARARAARAPPPPRVALRACGCVTWNFADCVHLVPPSPPPLCVPPSARVLVTRAQALS